MYIYIYKYNSDKCLSCKVCKRCNNGQAVNGFRYGWNNYQDNNTKRLMGG